MVMTTGEQIFNNLLGIGVIIGFFMIFYNKIKEKNPKLAEKMESVFKDE